MATLLFWINTDRFLWSHRIAVLRGARDAGYDVHVACDVSDLGPALRAESFTLHPLPLHAGHAAMSSSLRSFHAFYRLVRHVRPDIVHLVTIKPVLFGGIAARIAGVPARVAAISGLGFVFLAQGMRARVRRGLVGILYRLALGGNATRVIFQNATDRALITRLAGIDDDRIAMIPGSGVDLALYDPAPATEEPPLVVVAARLLLDKGIGEFVAAARELRARGVDARFVVAGDPISTNPAAVPPALLERWRQEKIVDFIGHSEDIAALYARATLVVLPSYREGMSKSLIEAAAAGRPVVTTDVPGCRDAIIPGETGLLVPVRDAGALADAIAVLLADPTRARQMGEAGRRLAEDRFRVAAVVDRHLAIYASLLADARQ